MSFAIWNDYLQLAANLVTVVGFPFAIFLFYNEKRRERREREYSTYNALDDKYISFLELCLEKPQLDVFDFTLPASSKSEGAIDIRFRQEQILFTILISILERAYLMYKDQSSDIKRKQWNGWVQYMEDYCKRENFRSQWPQLGPQFESEFVDFMNGLMAKTARAEHRD